MMVHGPEYPHPAILYHYPVVLPSKLDAAIHGGELPVLRSVPRSKLRPPRLRADRIDRPRLFAQLDRGLSGQFTLVSAPAGYGKTTLLTQWVQRQEMPVVWLSIEKGDDEPAYFMDALVAAFESLRPACCERVRSVLAYPTTPPAEWVAGELSNDIEEFDDFILVFDDVHNIKDARILEVIRTLVYQPPAPLHLVLSCRADPMLPLGALRGRGLLNEIRAADLRFDSDEAAVYLGQVFGHPLMTPQLTSLLDKTEGWPAGLHLAALSLMGRDDVDQGIREFAGSDRYIADYLIEELLGRLDPALQRYLTVTSILDRLTAPLCATLLQKENLESVEGKPVLEWLEESNLFVVSLDEQREWFRYHHLFRELLRHRLYATSAPEEILTLNLRAGEWLSASDRLDSAIEHFLKARRPYRAAHAIEAHRVDAINWERWRALSQWVEKVDAEIVSSRPALMLIYAWLDHERTDWSQMWRDCDRAEHLLDLVKEPGDKEQGLRGEIAALRAQVSFWQADMEKTLLYSQYALDHLTPGHYYASALAIIFKAAALQASGDVDAALELFAQAQGTEHPFVDTRLMVGMAMVWFISGQIDRPRRAAEKMLAWASEQGLETSIAWAHFHLGLAAYLHDQLPEAEHHFALVKPGASSINAAKESIYGLAWIRQSQGDIEQALELLDRLAIIVSELNLPLSSEVRLAKARLTALSGRPVSDLALAREVLESGLGRPNRIKLEAIWESSLVTALALLLLAGKSGDLDLCERAATTLVEAAESQHNVYRSIQCLALQAVALDRRGRRPEALVSLGKALSLAATGRIVRLFAEVGEDLYPLLDLLRHGEESGPLVNEVLHCFPAHTATHTTTSLDPGHDDSIHLLLTNRELDVLELLEQRLSNKEIAKHLVISPATVKRHTLSIYSKLDVGGRREAVAKARRLGLLASLR
jgi:LuxR family transcriptional regulator, maltose regulon positive regulatory protein